ncbi:MAG: hypothetical protein ABIR71_00250 [Chthoniobacterales bacterium]
MKPRLPRFFSSAIALSGVVFLSACATNGSKPTVKITNGKMFAVIADTTSFYRYGPQQGNGPDQELPRDTVMTLIRPSFGYSKVQLLAGAEGYVASEDIKPAPPTLLAALNAPPPSTHSGAGSERENFDIHSSEPPPPEDLPDPDLPPTSVEPPPEP